MQVLDAVAVEVEGTNYVNSGSTGSGVSSISKFGRETAVALVAPAVA